MKYHVITHPEMTVAGAIANWLADREITHAFGIIGGGNVALWDAIARLQKTEIVCVHHEQAAVMCAAYYQRASGRIALALVTTGGGSTNAFTGVMAAWMDSTPTLILSGNEADRFMGAQTRTWGVQGFDSAGAVERYSKYTMRMSLQDHSLEILDNAYQCAVSRRQGPVWVDIPQDVQRARS